MEKFLGKLTHNAMQCNGNDPGLHILVIVMTEPKDDSQAFMVIC